METYIVGAVKEADVAGECLRIRIIPKIDQEHSGSEQ
jgi:hypothetical protein